jgi:hypothetical protein
LVAESSVQDLERIEIKDDEEDKTFWGWNL